MGGVGDVSRTLVEDDATVFEETRGRFLFGNGAKKPRSDDWTMADFKDNKGFVTSIFASASSGGRFSNPSLVRVSGNSGDDDRCSTGGEEGGGVMAKDDDGGDEDRNSARGVEAASSKMRGEDAAGWDGFEP